MESTLKLEWNTYAQHTKTVKPITNMAGAKRNLTQLLSPRVIKHYKSPPNISSISSPYGAGKWNKAINISAPKIIIPLNSQICSPIKTFQENKGKFYSCHEQEEFSVNTPDRSNVLQHGLDARKISSILGKGGFGTVIQGIYKGQKIAVKLVPKSRNCMSSTSLINEANATELCHPNIVKVLKVINGEGNFGLVLMERNLGIDMQEIIHDPSFSLHTEKRIRYSLNVAYALEYCHHHNILHLDVKPRNILLCFRDDSCKLCDFGSSMKIRNHSSASESQRNLGINTVIYTAPELFRGRMPTKKSDVYSLGITLWQMLSRCVPYDGIESHCIIYKVVSEEYRPRKLVNVDEHQDYVKLYQCCWKADSKERPSMVEVIQELRCLKCGT